MNKKREYRYELLAILGKFGINGIMKKEFLDTIIPKIESQVEDQICGYAKQAAVDALCSVMKDRGYGPKRWQTLEQDFRNRLEDFDIMAEAEARDNIKNGNGEDIVWTKDKIDDEVRPLYVGYFLPYDKRYRKSQKEEHAHTWTEIREMAEND